VKGLVPNELWLRMELMSKAKILNQGRTAGRKFGGFFADYPGGASKNLVSDLIFN